MSLYDDASLIMYPSGYKASKIYSLKPTDGSGDLTFTRSSTATRVGSDGLIEKVRTNLLTQSQNFTSGWSGAGITATANFGVAPDGTTTSTRLVFSGAAQIWQKPVTGATGIGVFSLFIKGTAGETIQIAYGGVTDKLITLGTGWNRFNTDGNVALTTAMFINTFGGVTARTIEVWGGQVELGDIATPYIPTTTTAVSVGMLANVPRLDYTGGGCGKLLLEPQRTNVLTFSEQFNNAAWGKLNVTVSANQAVGPDGTTSADLVYPTTTGVDRVIEQLPVAVIGQTWTSSFFVKASGFSWVLMYAPNLVTCWFNASTGVFGTIGAGATATVLGQVNGYWRISLTGTVASSNAYLYVGPADANGTTTATANGTNGILIWGAQMEAGSYPTSYIPTLASSVTRLADAAFKTGISALIGQTQGTLFVELSSLSDSVVNEQISLSDGTDTNTIKFVLGSVVGGVSAQGRLSSITQFSITKATTDFVSNKKLAVAYKANDFVFYYNGEQVGIDSGGSIPAMSVFAFSTGASTFAAAGNINQALLFPTRLTNTQLAELTTL